LSRESDGGAIFWTNPHPLRSCPFSSFPTIEFAGCSKPPITDNHRKAPYPRTQQVSNEGGGSWISRDRDHTVAIKTAL